VEIAAAQSGHEAVERAAPRYLVETRNVLDEDELRMQIVDERQQAEQQCAFLCTPRRLAMKVRVRLTWSTCADQ
jgi:hypothetical protein